MKVKNPIILRNLINKTAIKLGIISSFSLIIGILFFLQKPEKALAYPPGVGILGGANNCLVCHASNGNWKDEQNTIIDILDKETKKSFKQNDGSFLIKARRGEVKTLITIIGRSRDDKKEAPFRNAWLYVDKNTIGNSSLSKFSPGWDVNLPMACRIVGDKFEGYEGAKITALPMSIRASDSAQDGELSLQVMLTKGVSVKGSPLEGLISNYFERIVKLKVIE